ncbi:hypothetical protein X975_23571, partial [Stegodyphus mimosarum]
MERRCVLNSWSKEEVRAVIRYEWARGVSGTEIHNRLVEVYGPGVMSKQMVRRWCRTFSDGRQQVEDIPRAGRTRTATTESNVRKVDDRIRANRRITIDEVAEELGISHERAQNIIHDILRYRKLSARWVPRQLTSTHKEQRMGVNTGSNTLEAILKQERLEAQTSHQVSIKAAEKPLQTHLERLAAFRPAETLLQAEIRLGK